MKKITELFNIEHPIIQGGMVWVSGAKLAAAVSNSGGLGLIGAGSMKPLLLEEHIKKAQMLTKKPIGVNIPLLYELSKEQIDTSLKCGIRIFFTSAGSPKKFTQYLKDNGAIVVHVTSNPDLALKCQEAGVDAIVAEGVEAGGHNGRDEITTMALIPQVKKVISIPLIAAGGIATGAGILAALSLGADGVQLGTRFLMTKESSAHDNFKGLLLKAQYNSTRLAMKSTIPVRLFNNRFDDEIKKIEENNLGENQKTELIKHLGKNRAKNGMLLGEIDDGELEIGQIISLIKNIPSAEEVMRDLLSEYHESLAKLPRSI